MVLKRQKINKTPEKKSFHHSFFNPSPVVYHRLQKKHPKVPGAGCINAHYHILVPLSG
jgi:hypothetical protein